MESVPVTPAFLINWGRLQIGPYIHINIDPVLLRIGPLALHWYGLMYVVAIVVGLWCIRIGYPSTLPWSTVYDNPNSFACANPSTCHVPVQPAAGYELLINVVLIVFLVVLARRSRRPGALLVSYLFGYTSTQLLVFFARANAVVPLFGLDWGLKQAQWTSLFASLALVPLTFLARSSRYATSVPAGEVPATYGIPQKSARQAEESKRTVMNSITSES